MVVLHNRARVSCRNVEMDTLYLNAGLPKTGSSAIQIVAFKGRARLLQHGLRYWDLADRHSRPLSIFFGESRVSDETENSWRRQYGDQSTIQTSLESFFASTGNLLISAEGISTLSRDALETLKTMSGRKIKVIVYVREPRSWFTSGVQQHIKSGETYDLAINQLSGYNRLRNMLGAFPDAVDIRLYRSSPDGLALIEDFMDALELPRKLLNDLIEPSVNASLSNRGVWLLDEINRRGEQEDHNGRLGMLRNVATSLEGEPFRIPAQDMEKLLDRFADDISWVSGLIGTDLLALSSASSGQRYEWQPDVVDLIYDLNSKLGVEKAKRHRLEGMLAEKDGDLAAARVAYSRAVAKWPDYVPAVEDLARLDGREVSDPSALRRRKRPTTTKTDRLERKQLREGRKKDREAKRTEQTDGRKMKKGVSSNVPASPEPDPKVGKRRTPAE